MQSGRSLPHLVVLLLFLTASLSAQQVAITDYQTNLTGDFTYPGSIAWGPDGALWFTTSNAAIGRLTAAGAISTYSVATTGACGGGDFGVITRGPDGALWFTEQCAGLIGRMTTSGAFTSYPIPTPNSSPHGITEGPDGALWFAEYGGNNIGRITTAGVITEFPITTPGTGPNMIATGPDGALWFTQDNTNQIGRMSTAGAITEYQVQDISYDNNLQGITAGPDGAMWFCDSWAGNIVRITMRGELTEYHISTYASQPAGITPGPDGALWFTETYAGKIGRITMDGVIADYLVPTTYPPADQGDYPEGITMGPDGALWFTDSMSSRIGEAVLPTATLTVSPSQGVDNEPLTFTGSGFAANETVNIYKEGIGSGVLATAMANSAGSFTVTAAVPQNIYGPRQFLSNGVTSKLIGAAAFQIEPRLSIDPQSGPAGSTVTARGFGLFPHWGVDIRWDTTTLGTAATNGLGTFADSSAFTFTVPGGSAPGTYEVRAGWNGITWATATFTVN